MYHFHRSNYFEIANRLLVFLEEGDYIVIAR